VIAVKGEFDRAYGQDGLIEEHVSGWQITFGRAVNGRLVLGGGSHIQLGFDAVGELEHIHFDWANYEQSPRKVKTAGWAELQIRRAKKTALVPAGMANTSETFECGYTDLGARTGKHRNRVSQVVPGCFATGIDQSLRRCRVIGQLVLLSHAHQSLAPHEHPERLG
jgi:hypothetical protein